MTDTTEVTNMVQIMRLVSRVKHKLPDTLLSHHLHDSRGLGIAYMIAGYEADARIFNTSDGGLKGYPFIKCAARNVPAEGTSHMFEYVEIKTINDLKKRYEVTDQYERILGRPLPSRMS